VNQHPEDAAAAGALANRALRCFIEAARNETFEPGSLFVHDPDRGVAGASQLACRVEHTAEHRVEIEIRHDEAPDVDQTSQAA
jgi:hypothetical protein